MNYETPYTTVEARNKNQKTRCIPITVSSNVFVNPVNYENLSAVKELVRIRSTPFDVPEENALSMQNIRKQKKKNLKEDTQVSVNTLKHMTGFENLARKASLSEPTLVTAKDRGDIFMNSDNFNESNGKTGENVRFEKVNAQQAGMLSGYLYIKHLGKTYKSLIEAKSMPGSPTGKAKRKCAREKTEIKNSKHGGLVNDMIPFWDPEFREVSKGKNEGFEIALFLSCGEKTEKAKPNRNRVFDFKKKKNEPEKKSRFGYKSSRQMLKPNVVFVNGKSLEPVKENLNFSNVKLFKQSIPTDFIKGRVKKGHFEYAASEVSSSSDYIYDEPKMLSRRKRYAPSKFLSNDFKALQSGYQEFGKGQKAFKARMMSQSSASENCDSSLISKTKINEAELWGKFKRIFKCYASTDRHSGEVIPRKISTLWMMNAGIVDNLITEKEADNAFRLAVGAKITMNAKEYKQFLIRLTLRLKLPYYEIYRRMCGD